MIGALLTPFPRLNSTVKGFVRFTPTHTDALSQTYTSFSSVSSFPSSHVLLIFLIGPIGTLYRTHGEIEGRRTCRYASWASLLCNII